MDSDHALAVHTRILEHFVCSALKYTHQMFWMPTNKFYSMCLPGSIRLHANAWDSLSFLMIKQGC